MPYRDTRWSMLLSQDALERAMQRADCSTGELALAAKLDPSTVSKLRLGRTFQVRTYQARNIEEALNLSAGVLFAHPVDTAELARAQDEALQRQIDAVASADQGAENLVVVVDIVDDVFAAPVETYTVDVAPEPVYDNASAYSVTIG